MNELTNQAITTGTYNSIPASLTSNISTVNLIDGIILTKEADKVNWVNDALTYTITFKNTTSIPFETATVTDKLDISLIDLDESSITINGAKAASEKYMYDSSTGDLTITIDTVPANDEVTITFSVTKKA